MEEIEICAQVDKEKEMKQSTSPQGDRKFTSVSPKVEAETPTVECLEQGCKDARFVAPVTTNSLRYTQDTLATEFRRIFEEEIMALRDAGQKEYAHDASSPFANFERAGKDTDVDPLKVLWIFAMKHKDGIAAYIQGHTSQREDVRGRINDLIVYLLLARGVINERVGSNKIRALGDLSDV